MPLRVLLGLACVGWGVACGGDGGTTEPPPPPDPPRPTTVTVSPATAELTALGATVQLTAEVRDQNGQVMGTITPGWSSSTPAVATVNAFGLVAAFSPGSTTVTATAGAASGSATVTVTQQVSAIQVTPATGIVLPDATLQLAAEAVDANGHEVAGAEFAWASSDTAVAVVDGAGLVTGVAAGEVEVTATSSGVTGRAQLEVVEPVPASLAVTPDIAVFEALGDTLRFVAEVQDQIGRPMPAEIIAWTASDTLVATVDATGLVTAVGNGSATITAASGAVAGDAAIEVMQVASRMAVSPSADTVLLGDSLRLTAQAFDANGRPVADAEIAWSSGNASVATVDTSGVVRGVGEGTVGITATTGNISGAARITVFNPDRAPLVALYNATNGPNWTRNDNWLTDAPVRDWHGVGTDATGRVTWLNLSGRRDGRGNWTRFGLKGTIPPELGSLDKLEDLWLFGNELSGTIPATLGDLASLERLDMSGNQLTGPIPAELGSATRLRQLLLHTNALQEAIPPELGSLAQLETLSIAGNRLSGLLPALLGDLASLKELDLSNNGLTGPIPSALGNLNSLDKLLLFNNELAGPIPPALGTLTDLTQLSLNRNDLTGPIPSELGELTNLTQLWLNRNDLTGPIPPALGTLTNLTTLRLDNNDLTGPIPSELGNLAALRVLVLSDNDLSGSMPSGLGNLASLTHLWLAWNGLTGSIPGELGQLTQLASLELNSNDLTGPIPSSLGDLGQLTHLDLSENALTGSIPGELGGTSLEMLDLHANNLTGPIPPTLANLANARHLVFGENNLSGPIPSELANLTTLLTLSLPDNGLIGAIPPELGNLDRLNHLGLGGNALTGPIPPGLGGLSALEELLLEENELEGPVPTELGALTALKQLNLTNNAGMAGTLSAEFIALTHLEVLLAGGTQLCVPSLPDFESWLGGMYRRRIARCPEASPSTAYLTQAVQSREFPVPLVAGEEALLRVFMTARAATREDIPPVRARFYVNDQERHQVDIPGRRSPIPVRVDESRLGRSANAVIPGQVIQPGLEMVIEVDPDGTLDPELGVARRIPETGRLRVEVHAVSQIDLTLIPFLWSEDPDSSIIDLVRGMAADPANHELLHETRTLLPVAGLDVTAHEPVVLPTNNTLELLSATQAIRLMEGGTGYYKGLMSGKINGPGGLAIRPGRSSFSQPHGQTLAHELGHNMSLRHAPCGGALGPDPAFPHSDGSIGAWGYDFRAGALVDPSTPDLMGYCGPGDWISDFFFSSALRFRLSDYDHPGLRYASTRGRTLLIWGGVGADGAPFIEPAFVMDAPASLPDAVGDHRLTGWTADGTELFSLSFAMPDVADGDGSSAFAFAVPVQSSWAGTLASITLSGPSGTVALDGDSDRAVAILRNPRSGQVRGIVRDVPAEHGLQVAAMAAPGAGAAFEVLISRGIPDAAAWR